MIKCKMWNIFWCKLSEEFQSGWGQMWDVKYIFYEHCRANIKLGEIKCEMWNIFR